MGRLLRAAASGGPLLAVLAVTAVSLLPLCGVLHRCGCTTLWSGGESACNVHAAQGAHCPWCEHRALGGAAAGATLLCQGLLFRAVGRRGALKIAAASATVAALPVLLLAAGFLAWLPTDYPHFLARDARDRLGLPEGPIRCVVGAARASAASCCPRGEGR